MSSSKDEIEQFLHDFKFKMGFWGLLIRSDRLKNQQTLLDLEITNNDVQQILNSLEVINYSNGPEQDIVYMGQPMWIFGHQVKNREVYIKISLGFPQDRVLCISFHVAEHPINYPFKQT